MLQVGTEDFVERFIEKQLLETPAPDSLENVLDSEFHEVACPSSFSCSVFFLAHFGQWILSP